MNKLITIGAIAAVAGCVSSEAPKSAAPVNNITQIKRVVSPTLNEKKNVPFKLGVARYTLSSLPFEHALDLLERIDCHYIGLINNGSLPLTASDAEIAAYKQKLAARGIEVISAGPQYYDNEQSLKKIFEFAKRYGLKYVSVVPSEMNPKLVNCKTKEEKFAAEPNSKLWKVESDKMLDLLEKYVKQYNIKAAIHNHGPDMPLLYPTGEAALKRIGNRDKRIGLCFDVGHERRAGLDPVKFINENSERIFEVHLKNIKIDPVANLAKEGPRGELDIPAIMKALAENDFNGYCLIEYEKDRDMCELPLAESFGYYRGIMEMTKVRAKLDPVPAGANTLSAKEKKEGWELLFDGKKLPSDLFVGVKEDCKAFPKKGWYTRDGYLTMYPMRAITEDGRWVDLPPEDQKLAGGGDIVSIKKYKDFEMVFDFRLTWAANSGVKYYYNEGEHQSSSEEYQILDKNHPDYAKPNHAGVEGVHRIAALYDLKPAKGAEEVVRPLGKWNHGRILAKGSHVEHWLNGVKVLEYERGSAEFRQWVKDSKYAAWEDKGKHWGEAEYGRILLQDHSDSTVSFCNLKIREIK